jgi:hypothetical protein
MKRHAAVMQTACQRRFHRVKHGFAIHVLRQNALCRAVNAPRNRRSIVNDAEGKRGPPKRLGGRWRGSYKKCFSAPPTSKQRAVSHKICVARVNGREKK